MVNYEISLVKGQNGEILVYGNYKSGNEPVYIERVNIQELDSAGNTAFISTHHVNRSIDPSPGSYLLVSKMPSGLNIKAASANAHYIVIDKIAKSGTIQL